MYEQPRIRGTIYTNTVGDDTNLLMEINTHRFLRMIHALQYPTQWIRKVVPDKHLNNLLPTSAFQTESYVTVQGNKWGKRMEFTATARKHGIDIHLTEPDQHNQSMVEGVIHELHKRWFRVMLKQRVPNRLWDYGIRWVCGIMQCTASNSRSLHGRTPLEQLTGETPDISEYLDFSFYDWCWYNDNAGLGETKLGRWLGV